MPIQFRWTAFVRTKYPKKHKIKDYVDHVEFKMNHTWGLKEPNIKKYPAMGNSQIGICFDGYGWFNLPIKIFFKKEHNLEPRTIDHDLYFENGGSIKTIEFDVLNN